MHAWGVQFLVLWACHALHAQKVSGVIGACFLQQKVLHYRCALAPGHSTFSAKFRAMFLDFSRSGAILLRRVSIIQGAGCYEVREQFCRRAPINNVLEAMMRECHLCGMGTGTASCCHQSARMQRVSSTRALMRALTAMHRAPALTMPTAVMEGSPAASCVSSHRGGRPMRRGRRRRPHGSRPAIKAQYRASPGQERQRGSVQRRIKGSRQFRGAVCIQATL